MKRLLLAVTMLTLLLPAFPGVAHAETLKSVATALRSNPVYQSPGIDLLDSAALQPTLRGSKPTLYVVALPAAAASSAADARTRAQEIGGAVADTNAVVLVITLSRHLGTAQGNGASNQGVDAAKALADQLEARKGQSFDKASITTLVKELQGRLAAQVSQKASPSSSSKSSGRGAALLIGLVVLAALVLGLFLVSSRKRRATPSEGLPADGAQV